MERGQPRSGRAAVGAVPDGMSGNGEPALQERTAALARSAAAMLEAADPAAVGEIAIESVRSVTGAIAAGLALYEESDDTLVPVARYGFAPEVAARFSRYPAASATPVADVLRAAVAKAWDADEFVAEFPGLASLVEEDGYRSLVAVPLKAKGRVIGGISAAFGDAAHGQPAEVGFLEALGSAAAAAVERLRALESERRRTLEAEALARVTRALMDARSFEEIGELAWREVATLLGASRGAFFMVDWATGELVLVGRPGMPERLQAVSERVPLSLSMGVTDAVKTAAPILIESAADYAARYPHSLSEVYGRAGEGAPAAMLAVPVRGHAHVIGTLSFGFLEARRFPERDIWLAQSFADSAATAIERLRFLQAEQASRKRAAALARASAALFEANDPFEVGRIVLEEARAVTGAGTGTITLLDSADATIHAIATFGQPAGTLPPSVRRPASERSIVADVIRGGKTIVINGPEDYGARYPGFAEMIRKTGCRAFAGVPLNMRGQTIGGFSLAYMDRDRVDAEEVSLLESIGTTAAEAIERLRSHTLLEAVLSQMPVGVSVSDPRGRILATNERVAELWHSDPQQPAYDYDMWKGFHADGRPFEGRDWPIWRSLQRGEMVLGEAIEIERFDGTRGTLEYSSAPMRDEHGSVIGAVVVVSDATGRVEAERAREAFLAVLSHELRTPITSILLAARQLRERGETVDPEVRHGLFVDLEAEAERLNRVVGNLLVLSRVERGSPLTIHEPVLLQHLLPGLFAAEEKLWPEVKFRLISPGRLPMVQGEPGYLEQVIRNLMANAAKYGGGEVEVSAVTRGRELEIRVRDWGPGIRPEDRQRIFDLFYRVEGMRQTAVGAGIGLFVVRNLVEAMGGRVWAEDPDGPGACIVVALPLLEVEGA